MKKLFLLSLVTSFLVGNTFLANAQESMKKKNSKISVNSSADASLFQIALTEIGGQSDISTLRYSYFFNSGTDVNYHVSDKLSVFSGLSIKNLGLIRKLDTLTSKYRVYTIGLPLGLKIKTKGKQHIILGGGVDFPINYKAKSWTDGRQNKEKSNEWFSKQVSPVMPYTTLGYHFNMLVVKFNYYPINFWNDNYFSNQTANIIALSLGFDIGKSFGKKAVPIVKKSN